MSNNESVNRFIITEFIQHKNQWEIRQREDEISELQKALSDMQVQLLINTFVH